MYLETRFCPVDKLGLKFFVVLLFNIMICYTQIVSMNVFSRLFNFFKGFIPKVKKLSGLAYTGKT